MNELEQNQVIAEQLTFDDWYCDYIDALYSETEFSGAADKEVARRHWNRGTSPEAAAKEDAHFMATGG